MPNISLWFTQDKKTCYLISKHNTQQEASLHFHLLVLSTPGIECLIYENYFGVIEVCFSPEYGSRREFFIITNMEGEQGDNLPYYNMRFASFYAPAQKELSVCSKDFLLGLVLQIKEEGV